MALDRRAVVGDHDLGGRADRNPPRVRRAPGETLRRATRCTSRPCGRVEDGQPAVTDLGGQRDVLGPSAPSMIGCRRAAGARSVWAVCSSRWCPPRKGSGSAARRWSPGPRAQTVGRCRWYSRVRQRQGKRCQPSTTCGPKPEPRMCLPGEVVDRQRGHRARGGCAPTVAPPRCQAAASWSRGPTRPAG